MVHGDGGGDPWHARQPTHPMEVACFDEIGAVCRVGYLHALVRIVGQRAEHLGEGLRLDGILEQFRLLDRQADHAVG